MDDQRYSDKYLSDAWVAFIKRKPIFYTHAFLDINVILESLLYILHEALNFSDSPCSIVALSKIERISADEGAHQTQWGSLHAQAQERGEAYQETAPEAH